MKNIKINEQILDGIREQCKDDRIMEEFLTKLIYEEAEHPGQWRWKEVYKTLIEQHSADWEAKNEN